MVDVKDDVMVAKTVYVMAEMKAVPLVVWRVANLDFEQVLLRVAMLVTT